jgi:hypothetical protein
MRRGMAFDTPSFFWERSDARGGNCGLRVPPAVAKAVARLCYCRPNARNIRAERLHKPTNVYVVAITVYNAVMEKISNQAFIDAQNLYLGTTTSQPTWKVDLVRFRIYLTEKYQVDKAYYFLGSFDSSFGDLYNFIQEAGFILAFREHSSKMTGKKKGNVDTDIVFSIMRKLYVREFFNKIILVSGDGDYNRMVDFLISEGKFEKLLLPNRRYASSLYKNLPGKYKDYLDNPDVMRKLRYKKRDQLR